MITAKCIANINDPCNGKIIEQLEIGKEYGVENISMGGYHTTIFLKEIKVDGCGGFNSVLFEFFENGEPLDIYEDERFNPYL